MDITGFAVFDGFVLCDVMSGGQAQAVLAVRDLIRGGYQQVISGGRYLTLRVEKASARVISAVENGRPKMMVRLYRTYSVDDSTPGFDFLDETVRHRAEQLSGKQTLSQLQDTLAWAKERRLDVFAFGERLYRYHSRETPELLQNWRTAFTELEVTFDVDVTILGAGAIMKSIDPPR